MKANLGDPDWNVSCGVSGLNVNEAGTGIVSKSWLSDPCSGQELPYCARLTCYLTVNACA